MNRSTFYFLHQPKCCSGPIKAVECKKLCHAVGWGYGNCQVQGCKNTHTAPQHERNAQKLSMWQGLLWRVLLLVPASSTRQMARNVHLDMVENNAVSQVPTGSTFEQDAALPITTVKCVLSWIRHFLIGAWNVGPKCLAIEVTRPHPTGLTFVWVHEDVTYHEKVKNLQEQRKYHKCNSTGKAYGKAVNIIWTSAKQHGVHTSSHTGQHCTPTVL